MSAFHRASYESTQHFIPAPEERWKGIEEQSDLLKRFGFEDGKAPEGAYVDRFDLHFMWFKIPTNEDDLLIPQATARLKVAEKALQVTDLERGKTSPLSATGNPAGDIK